MLVVNSLSAAGEVVAGSSFADTTGLHESEVGVIIAGTFVATVAIEVSADGTNWVEQSSVTAPTFVKIPLAPHVRVSVTAWTSGTVTADILAY